jgi:hypothetical protein
MEPKNQPEPGFLAPKTRLESPAEHKLSPSLIHPATQPATPAAQPMVACGSDEEGDFGLYGSGVDLCPGCAAVPLPDPFELYCPACWAGKGGRS